MNIQEIQENAKEYIKEVIEVPTGHILIIQGEHGLLECLSLSDYGKEKNVKASFLGLENDINGVIHGEMLPLEDKWVITISSQYGCSMGCKFCDVPKVGPGRNATETDILRQFFAVMSLHPEVKSSRINLHYARMGEPSFNHTNVIKSACKLSLWFKKTNYQFHPVVSTMMPKNNTYLRNFLYNWMQFKEDNDGEAGLQLSINSTDREQRKNIFGGTASNLDSISSLVEFLPVSRRKIALNFALCSDSIIDAKELKRLFSPDKFMCKITPMHETKACEVNNLHTPEGYSSFVSYKPIEEALKAEGFDVIVFVPSLEEDKGRITCGNAILSDERFKEINK